MPRQHRRSSTNSTNLRSNPGMTNDTNPQPQSPPNGAPAGHDHESAPEHAAVSGKGALVGVIIVLVAIVALAVHGIWKRHHNDEVLADTTQQLAAPSVIAI